MVSQSEVEAFIGSSFRSVWALELLRLLLVDDDRAHSQADLVEAMRSSDAVVAQSLATLVAGGLVAVDGDGSDGRPRRLLKK